MRQLLMYENSQMVIITGASRGVVAEIARVYAREGASVIVNYCQSMMILLLLFLQKQS